MAHLTRKELKQDPFLSTYYDDFVEFAEKHYSQLVIGAVIIAIAVFAVVSWKHHEQHQEAAANALLGSALAAFQGYVGAAPADALGAGAEKFATEQEKYQTALRVFNSVVELYPRQKAGEIALYHVGICEARLGNQAAAVTTLQKSAQSSGPDISSLARFALADELAQTGKLSSAEGLYKNLALHPTQTVPATTAWLALADTESTTNPAGARQIYERLSNQAAGSDAYLAEVLKQKLADLPQSSGE